MKPFRETHAARREVDAGVDYYLSQAGADVALAFLAEYEAALEHMRTHPGTGSPRYGEVLDIDGLRFWMLKRFPYAVFYIERDAYIEVVRVLHQYSDIPVHLQIGEAR